MYYEKKYRIVFLLLFLTAGVLAQDIVVKNPVRFLALGDSYTIGQGVDEEDRWPNQLIRAIEKLGAQTKELSIIARTGWTTKNLLDAISDKNPDSGYNLVSLLIGVNNQYQGVSINIYPDEFRQLLETALAFCGGRQDGVFVLSIPDYGYTPFGLQNQATISAEIDEYNRINKQITAEMGITYFDITPISREVTFKPSYLASDNLHPSQEMYARWVEVILDNLDLETITTNATGSDTANEVTVYPNPAHSQLTIRIPQDANSIEIYDARGLKVWQSDEAGSLKFTIDVSKWKNGIYFYQITTHKNTRISGKIRIEP